jgi:hypothetical protein
MPASEPLLAVVGFAAAVVVTLVDGRRAIGYASLAAALGLAAPVSVVYGGDAALVLVAAAALAAFLTPATRAAARRISWMAGVDPAVPVVARGEALFGPRSVRAAAAVVVLPAASWVSFNVPLGSASTVRGVLFPAALVWGCGCMRLLTARTLNDVAVGVAAVGLGASAAWFLCAGTATLPSAVAAASLAPAAALTAGWLSGRHSTSSSPARTSA